MAKTDNERVVLIMAGGIGSRFWPVSRSSHPKQFIDILGVGKSLLQLTYDRFCKLVPEENIYIVANQAYRSLIRTQLPHLSDEQVIAEPMARNTAPCIAYATHKVGKKHPKASFVVAPSDHLILDDQAFIKSLEIALDFTEEKNCLLTLGIQPSRPDTGYGYIQFVECETDPKVCKVKTFTEKPSAELARTFIESGEFLWNAGIFIWSMTAIKNALEVYLPDINRLFKSAVASMGTEKEEEVIMKAYTQCQNISIDYGIMEKADNVYVRPADFGWSDLGTWKSLYENKDKDSKRNAAIGKRIILEESEGCMVYAGDDKLVVIKGVKDVIVVDAGDVLLVCDKNKEQEVKQIVTDIKIKFDEKYT